MPHAPDLTGDLVVGNFEGVLADTGTTYKCGPEGRRVPDPDTAPPEAGSRPPLGRSRRARRHRGRATPSCTPTALAPRLVEAGFTHLNLANNHANDFGPAGRASTERILDSLGLRHYGPLGRIAVDTCAGATASTTVGLVGFTTYPYAYDLLDIARSAAVVDSVRPLVDLLVVTFHGGRGGRRALHVPRGRRVARDASRGATCGGGPAP